jgi:hypothetical protein
MRGSAGDMNISREIEIITFKSELDMIGRHVRALTSSVLIGRDDLYDEIYLHTRIVITSITSRRPDQGASPSR